MDIYNGSGLALPEYLYGFASPESAHPAPAEELNRAFSHMRIPAVFMLWHISPVNLGKFMDAMSLVNIRGCALDAKLRRPVLPLLDSVSERAAMASHADTIFWRDGMLSGENMAAAGFSASLGEFEPDKISALVLGAGQLAHACVAALRLGGCRDVRVAAPDDKSQYGLAERFGFCAIPWSRRHAYGEFLVVDAVGKRDVIAYEFDRAPQVAGGWAFAAVGACGLFMLNAGCAGRHVVSPGCFQSHVWAERFRLWTGRNLPEDSRENLQKSLDGE